MERSCLWAVFQELSQLVEIWELGIHEEEHRVSQDAGEAGGGSGLPDLKSEESRPKESGAQERLGSSSPL